MDRDEEFYVGNIICIYICMYVSNFKSFLSLEVYDYIDDRDDCNGNTREYVFITRESENFNLIFTPFSTTVRKSSTLITKKTIIIIMFVITHLLVDEARRPSRAPVI